jgi:protocatechuate 3,4-dioxygenase beta subunit
LFRLSGLVACLSGPVSVILSSETGRRSTQTVCGGQYLFEGLAPAVYEVFASVPGGGEVGFIELFLDRDNDSGTVQLMPPAQVEFEVRRAGSDRPANIAVTLMGRRQDLSESEKEHVIEMPKTTLVPGHWEMNALVAPDQYVESIIGRGQSRRSWRVERNPDWHDVFVEIRMPARVRITVSDKAGHIEGSVLREDKGVPGAPVFLWPVAESARRSLNGSRQILSDTEGRFRFDGLPPGEYRVLATFDFSEMDLEAFNEARAPTVRVEASQTTRTELPLWIAP